MSASEVKAGSAYVEIGAKLNKLATGLSAATAMLGAWRQNATANIRAVADGMMSVGAKLTGLAAGMAAPLAISAKAFADYGEDIGKLASKTGMSADALSGLKYQAESSGIAMTAVSAAVKGMQKAVVSGSKESKEALQKLGITAEELKSMTPEEQFARLADGIASIQDPAERAAAAQALFGRAAMEIMPILEGGSAEMARMQREARQLGLILGPEATAAAAKLDTALDRLGGALIGLKLHIGAALAPLVTDFVNGLIDVVIYMQEWVDANPAAVQSFAKLAVEIALAGAALLAVGAAVAALMSPVVMTTVAIVGIGMAALAVADVLGVTATGFGELFNSVRIGGIGLGTWLTGLALSLEKTWVIVTSNIEFSFKAIYYSVVGIFSKLRSWLYGMYADLVGMVRRLIEALPKRLQFGVDGVKSAETFFNQNKRIEDQKTAEGDKDLNGILFERDKKVGAIDKRMWNTFAKDPNDGSTGINVDTDRAKKAGQTIMDNVWKGITGAAGGALDKLGVKRQVFEEPAKKIDTTVSAGAGGKAEFSSVGTFSGLAASQLAGNSAQLTELRTIAAAAKGIEKNTASPDAGGVVF